MLSSSWTAAALLGVTSLLAIAPGGVEGHVYMMGPVSRQLYGTTAFQENGAPGINYCPHCFQSRGPSAIRERAGGAPWPHFNGERAANGNYIESDDVSKRHGICGDPEQTAAEGSNLYGMENSNYPVLETFAQGDVLEVKIVVSTYHWGHVEVFICDAADLPGGPEGTVIQSCFNKYPLDRAPDDENEGGPIDPENPGRFFLDPPCRAEETDQEMVPGATTGAVATARYLLPKDLTCKHCTVQMVYYTGNSCKHQGYAEFNPPSWPSSCAPTKADWINEVVGQCGDGDAYPEEFWNCADIEISSDGSPSNPESDDGGDGSSDDTEPTPEPMPEPTDPESEDGGDGGDDGEDSAEPTPAPTPTPTESDSPDDNTEAPAAPGGDDSGDGECADPVLEHDQCGGTDYTGSTCCESGLQCQKMAECWSECRVIVQPTPDGGPDGGSADGGSADGGSEDGGSEDGGSEDECAENYGKCGGVDWAGPTCCKSGAQCNKYNDHHSQCEP